MPKQVRQPPRERKMSNEPLFPHVPGKREPLYPHVSKPGRPILHEAITLNPDPLEFTPVEVNSAFPASAKSVLSPEEKAKIDELIEDVPDENDTMEINYWVGFNGEFVYLEGWIDKCLAGTGFPEMEGGEWDKKVEYMVRVGGRTLIEKQEERNRPRVGPGFFRLIEGGFREFEAGDRDWLYGVTWGVYTKPEKTVVPEPVASEKRLEYELKKGGFITETREDNPATVLCPLCKQVIDIPQYDKVSRSDALVRHIKEEHTGWMAEYKGDNPSGNPHQEEGERIAQQIGNGIIYNGPQMLEGELYAHLFTDVAVTGTTFACLDLEGCKANLIQKRKDFGAAPPTFRGNPESNPKRR